MLPSAVRAALARYNCSRVVLLPAFNADDLIHVQPPQDAQSVLLKLMRGYVLVYGILAAVLDTRSRPAAFAFVPTGSRTGGR